MLKKKDLQEKLKKVEDLILSGLHLYGKNSKKREQKLVKDIEKFFKLKSTQNTISFLGCPYTLDAKKFDDFVKEFSLAEVNFFVRLFTTNRMKLTLLGNRDFDALVLEDYHDLHKNIEKREQLLKARSTVFFVIVSSFTVFSFS